jgi:hypothetical protein
VKAGGKAFQMAKGKIQKANGTSKPESGSKRLAAARQIKEQKAKMKKLWQQRRTMQPELQLWVN